MEVPHSDSSDSNSKREFDEGSGSKSESSSEMTDPENEHAIREIPENNTVIECSLPYRQRDCVCCLLPLYHPSSWVAWMPLQTDAFLFSLFNQ